MITTIKQDITTVTHGIIAHGVNCQGVMGSGVAGAIKQKWPTVYNEYKAYCNTLLSPSEALGIVQTVHIADNLIVANCFTQLNYGRDGKKYASPEAIHEAFESLIDYSIYTNLPIYTPKIGCGLGGLSWEDDVQPILRLLMHKSRTIYDRNIEMFVCEI